MKKPEIFFQNKYYAAAAVFLLWLVILGGGIFTAGEIFESVALFILLYNLVYPVATAAVCYVFAKKKGLVVFLPAAMTASAAAAFAFTELMRYAEPNPIVMTLIAVFFGSGIGNVMHGDGGKKPKDKNKDKYKNILDD